MDEAVIRKRVIELVDSISTMPQSARKTTAGGIYQSDLQPQEPLDETLSHLQVQIKYLLFDLEATRRENRYLRQLLENRQNPPRKEEGEDGPPF